MTISAEIAKGCTLQDLLWEHDKFTDGMLKLFEQYRKKLDNENRQKYDKETERILFNSLGILSRTIELNFFEVYIEDFNKSLKMLFVIPHEDYLQKEDLIYDILPKIQSLSIDHEGRDFRWSVMSDKHLVREMLDSEYDYKLEIEAANA